MSNTVYWCIFFCFPFVENHALLRTFHKPKNVRVWTFELFSSSAPEMSEKKCKEKKVSVNNGKLRLRMLPHVAYASLLDLIITWWGTSFTKGMLEILDLESIC